MKSLNNYKKNTQPIMFRPLYVLEKLLSGTEYVISYTYDDLIFIEHSHILFKFMDQGEEIGYYINSDISKNDREIIQFHLSKKAESEKILLFYLGQFTMEQETEKEEIKLNFYN